MRSSATLACGSEHCITCADEGVEMRVVALGPDGLADCAGPEGARSEVEVALVEAVAPGDALLVHAGVAIAHLGRAA